ncbi:MAG: hypothetical protein NTV46_03465 [Verrucomicrobia bacterium]|nr:hypothetical protein [Verrucomicrobiota bacterium]
MARQSVQGDGEREFLTPNGDHVELGAWNDLRNRVAKSRKHRFAIELEAKLSPLQISANVERRFGNGNRGAKDGKSMFYEGTPLCVSRVRGDVMYQLEPSFGMQEIVITNRDGGRLYSNTIRNLKGSSLLNPRKVPGEDLLISMADDLRFLDPARKVIGNVKHLSALRQDTRGVIELRTPSAGDVGHEGQYCLQHLVSILTDGARKGPGQLDFILRHSRAVLHVDNLKVHRTGEGLVLRPEGRNMDTKASHRLSDFGFGVSQALPVFVQGAIMEDGEVLTVEQPEAQLHPTAQLELGSFFAELWKKRGVASIIESHSGNVLLRLKHLVRKGDLSPDDVGVCYVLPVNGTTEVRNLRMKADGDLEDGLEMEFFGADVFEAIEVNALPKPRK